MDRAWARVAMTLSIYSTELSISSTELSIYSTEMSIYSTEPSIYSTELFIYSTDLGQGMDRAWARMTMTNADIRSPTCLAFGVSGFQGLHGYLAHKK